MTSGRIGAPSTESGQEEQSRRARILVTDALDPNTLLIPELRGQAPDGVVTVAIVPYDELLRALPADKTVGLIRRNKLAQYAARLCLEHGQEDQRQGDVTGHMAFDAWDFLGFLEAETERERRIEEVADRVFFLEDEVENGFRDVARFLGCERVQDKAIGILETPYVLDRFASKSKGAVLGILMALNRTEWLFDSSAVGLRQEDPDFSFRSQASPESQALGLAMDAMVQLRLEHNQLVRSLAAIEEHLHQIDHMPWKEPHLPLVAERGIGVRQEASFRVLCDSEGLAGLGLTLSSSTSAQVDIDLVGLESGLFLGKWHFEVPPRRWVDAILGMRVALLDSDRELEVRLRVSGSSEVYVGPVLREQAPANIQPTVFRWPAGLRTPSDWPFRFPKWGNERGDGGKATWRPEEPHAWHVIQSGRIQRIRRFWRRAKLLPATSDSFDQPGDFVQLHPDPGNVVFGIIDVAGVQGGWLVSEIAHEASNPVRMRLAIWPKDQPLTARLLTRAVNEPFAESYLVQGDGRVKFRIPEGAQRVLIATDQDPGVSNEYAWARFRVIADRSRLGS